MKDAVNVAVVGATGMVGETMLDILAERGFPIGKLHALASERSLGKTVNFGNKELPCEVLDDHDFSDTDIALFSAGGSISAEHGIGLLKKPYLSYTRSAADIERMRGIKAVFDPFNIMNPGKLF